MTYHVINLIAKPPMTVVIDGVPGINGIRYVGGFPKRAEINLQSEYGAGGVPFSATGSYWTDAGASALGGRLIVKGVIYNARGSDTEDYIGGNIYDNVIYGDAGRTGIGGSDTLFGDEGNDTIYGGPGNDDIGGAEGDDILFGDEGEDKVSGGSGIDVVEGGAGGDTLSGGANPGDTVSYAGSDAGVKVNLTPGETTVGKGGHARNDTINGFTDVIGSKFDDVIVDTMKGTIAFGGNANTFDGKGGDDRLVLGGGDDNGFGGNGSDDIRGEAGNDRLWGENGRDRISGGAGADLIEGGGGKDTIAGGADDDTLVGGSGKDQLAGGGGGDTFVFNAVAGSGPGKKDRDVILDFSRGQRDRIDLSPIDAKTGTAKNDKFKFIGESAFSGAKGELRHGQKDDKTFIYADVDGDGKADFGIEIAKTVDLKAGDFSL